MMKTSKNKIQRMSGYSLDLPTSNNSMSEDSVARLIDSLMSLPVGEGLNSDAGILKRIDQDTFKVVITDEHIDNALSESMITSGDRGIDRGY